MSHVDVTDRRLAEAAVEDHASELQDRTDSLSLVNRIVRHDVANDMEVIEGYASLLEDHVDEEGQKYLAQLQDSASRVVDLSTSLGRLSDSIVREAEVDLRPVDPVAVVEDQVRRTRRRYRETPGDLTVVGPDAPPDAEVLADDLLSSVVGNLLDNAAKHAGGDARVEVDVEVVGDRIRIDVADDGPGFEDEDAVLDRAEKGADSGGSGLGLYLVDRLVEVYGGSVAVGESHLGGALVSVELDRVSN